MDGADVRDGGGRHRAGGESRLARAGAGVTRRVGRRARAIYAAFATVNILGVERGARREHGPDLAKMLPLLLLIAAGLFAIDAANLAIGEPPTCRPSPGAASC